MPTFRRTDRDFTEGLFKNAKQQQAAEGLGSEQLKEYLIDPRTGEILPVKFEQASLQIDQHGFPVVVKERADVLMDCGHKPCSLEQVLGRCKYGHTVCDKCALYTCEICGQKLCDQDVLRLEDESPFCPEHDKDLMKARVKIGLLQAAGDTLKYLCGWDGEEYDE